MANKTILDFPSASTPLNLTDILYLLQGSGTDRDRQTSLEDLQAAIVTTLSPIGEIKQYDKSFPNTPTISTNWVECDGALISDSDSPYDGYRARNLNGGSVVLSGVVWASGVATVAATDVTGLGVGDFVVGSGIAADSYITNITGNVVTISDTAFSGTISTTFSNDGRFIRGGSTSGVSENHAVQDHTHYKILAPTSPGAGDGTAQSPQTSEGQRTSSNGGMSSGNIDTETRPINTSQVFIMRIK
jgi:hypothetical protein